MQFRKDACFFHIPLLYFFSIFHSGVLAYLHHHTSSGLESAVAATVADQLDTCQLYTRVITYSNGRIPKELGQAFSRHIFYNYLPKAQVGAGEYTHVNLTSDINNWLTCVGYCCNIEDCDVALYTNQKCYHIKCNRDPPDACAPVKVSEHHNETVMVLLGDVHAYFGDNDDDADEDNREDDSMDTSSLEDWLTGSSQRAISPSSSSSSTSTEQHSSLSSSSPSPVTSSSSSSSPKDSKSSSTLLSSSSKDESSSSSSSSSSPSSSSSSSSSSTTTTTNNNNNNKKLVGQACVSGLDECQTTAHCVKPESSKTRQGVCACLDGYHQTTDHSCEKDAVPQVFTPADNKAGSTPKPSPSTPKPVTKLTVSAGQNRTLQLPTNSVKLSTFVLPKADEGEKYSYEWSSIKFPDDANAAKMEGKNTEILTLSELVAGLYVLKIKVTGDNKFGEAIISVTVIPPKRENKAPVAIINPTTQKVFLPNSAILDGSGSTDDDKIVTYKWEEVSGPLQNHDLNTEGQMLTVKGMVPGNYVFRLTVTDSDGATNSTEANVIIQKEKDYPPKADAGSDVVIHLPQNSLTLYGNGSSDDNGELQYEWIKYTDDKLTAGMLGVRSPFLHLSNLEVGDYRFSLKVTDSAGQTDTADVHVFVKPESNHPPVAKTAGELTVFLPKESLTLDGSASSDDKDGPLEFSWTQTGGPTTLTITNSDKSVALATGEIKEAKYEFKLTVTDGERQQASETLAITVKSDINQSPVANAGGDKVTVYPASLITLNGTASTDDHGIKTYSWKRNGKSLAAGAVVNGSDRKPVLQLVDLIVGQYLYTLTVEDAEGLTSSDSVTVLIKKNPHEKDVVELILKADIDSFTTSNKENLIDQLELLFQSPSEDQETVVNLLSLKEDISTGHLVLAFLVSQRMSGVTSVVPGTKALSLLQNKLEDSGKILDYSIVRLDLVLCQNNCSSHGYCNQKTKLCVCEAFWMPNVFTSSIFSSKSNCDWSILYVVIICFIILVAFISLVWTVVCCCTSKKCKVRFKGKRRHRYSLLRDKEDNGTHEKLEMMTKSKIQNSSVMISESDISSDDEETLFISNKKPSNGLNGKLSNGMKASSYRTNLKT